MEKIKILIADDQHIIRDGLKLILDMEDDMETIGLASNGDEAFNMCEKGNVDVVLMDIRMPVCDGVLGTKKICSQFPNVKVIILTTFNDDDYIFEALKGGAKGYLLKDVSSDELVNSIRMVQKGGFLLHPDTAAKLISNMNMPSKSQKSDNELTPREAEIVKMVGLGKSNREIAKELYLSEGTVKNHITSILSKLYLRDRTQIALYASQNKLVP